MLKPLTGWIKTNWNILQEMGIPDHLTCLLRKLYASQEATELDMEQKLGKEYVKAVYCHCLFNLYAEYIIRNAGLDDSQAGIKIAGRNVNNLRYPDDNHFKGRK